MNTSVIVWSGWVGGAAIGAYVVTQWWLTNRALGCSKGYQNACTLVMRGGAAPGTALTTSETTSDSGWRLWFILGIPLGGLVAVLTSPGAQWQAHWSWGEAYEALLPTAFWGKAAVLTAGGFLMGLGARIAGGCPSGHTINGVSLLNIPSVIASIGFFVGGLATVQLMFRVFA